MMVQVASETPSQGTEWNIHIAPSLRNQDENSDNTEAFQMAVKAAQYQDCDLPAWTQEHLSTPTNHVKITQRAIDVYMLSKKANGEMGGIGWWQTANGYTAMALHDLWSGSCYNYGALKQAIRECESNHRNLVHPWNDDMLWWGMLCIHIYAIKQDKWFLDQAVGIWKHVKQSVCGKGEVFFQDRDMEGAVFWTTRPGEHQINSITTGLFAELSVRLALISEQLSEWSLISRESLIEAARCSLGWILRCRYRPRQGLILDNINLKEGKVNDWIFTYNTGVSMCVCALLFQATKDEDYIILAHHMAIKAMTRTGPKGWVEDDGVLTEKHAYGRGTHDPMKPNDAVGFKAVLLRQLCTLYNVIDRMQQPSYRDLTLNDMIRKFVNINFRSQLDRNTNGKGQYGPWWAGPFECPTSHSQMAVLDIMAAVRLVNG